MKLSVHKIISLLVITLSWAACSDNPTADSGPASAPEEIVLKFTFSAGKNGMSRGETETDADTRIDDVLVLLFTETSEGSLLPGKLWKAVAAENLSADTGDGHRTFDVKFSKGGSDVPKHLLPVVVANAASRLDNFLDDSPLSMSYEDVMAMCTDNIQERASSPAFTFWGIAEKNIDTEVRVQSMHINLVRDLARITLNLAETLVTADGYRPAALLVYNRVNSISLLPSLESLGESGVPERPTVPSSPDKSECDVPEELPYGDYVPLSIIVPEQDVLMGGDGTDANDDFRFLRPALVAGIYFKNRADKIYWYRVDFHDAAGNLADVIRNHHYMLNVRSVDGPGEDTPREAYYSQTAHVSADIISWDDEDRDVAFDGSSYIAISRSVILGGTADDEIELEFSTNVSPELWEMAWCEPGASADDLSFTSAPALGSTDFGVIVECPESVGEDGIAALKFKTTTALDEDVESSSACLYINVTPKLRLVVNVTRIHESDSGMHSPWGSQTIYEVI